MGSPSITHNLCGHSYTLTIDGGTLNHLSLMGSFKRPHNWWGYRWSPTIDGGIQKPSQFMGMIGSPHNLWGYSNTLTIDGWSQIPSRLMGAKEITHNLWGLLSNRFSVVVLHMCSSIQEAPTKPHNLCGLSFALTIDGDKGKSAKLMGLLFITHHLWGYYLVRTTYGVIIVPAFLLWFCMYARRSPHPWEVARRPVCVPWRPPQLVPVP